MSEKPPARAPIESAKLPAFALPDMSIVTGTQSSETDLRVPVNFKGKNLLFNFHFTRERETENRENEFHGQILLKITDQDVEGFSELASFRCTLRDGKISPAEYRDGDESKHRYWDFFNRKIDKSIRKQGLAEYCIRTVEDLIARFSETYPHMRHEWIQMDTRLSSLSRLVVDQEWLKRQGLGHLAKKSGVDFHYVPHPRDAERALELLQGSSVEIGEVSRDTPFVRFMKRAE